MIERGVIRNREHAQQLRDFSGLKFHKITPTDIDGFVEFGDRLFVFIEAKYNNATLPYGQKLALQRLCDACHNPPHRYAIVLVAKHETKAGDVDYANAVVTETRWKGNWRYEFRQDVTVRAAIDSMRVKFLGEKT